MVKLAKIGYVRVRSERHLTVSRKIFIFCNSTDGLSLPIFTLVTALFALEQKHQNFESRVSSSRYMVVDGPYAEALQQLQDAKVLV